MYRTYFIQPSTNEIFSFITSILIFGVIIWAIIFWIKMLVHLMESKSEDKIAWSIILVSTNIIGAIVYYYVVINKKQNKKTIKK